MHWIWIVIISLVTGGVAGVVSSSTQNIAVSIMAAVGGAGISAYILRNRAKQILMLWKENAPQKKILLFLVAMITALSIPLRFLTIRINDSYTINIAATGTKNEDSANCEVWIDSIDINGKSVDLSTINLTEGWNYKEANDKLWISPSGGSESVPLVIGPYDHVSAAHVTFGTNAWSGMVCISTPTKEYVTDLYSSVPSEVSYSLEASYTLISYLLGVLGYIVICLWMFIILLSICPLRSLFYALGYALVFVALWLTTEWIRPAPSVILFLVFLSCYSFWKYKSKKDAAEMSKYKQKGISILIFVVSLYASFASFGYRLFLSGDYMTFSRERLVVFLLGVVWFYPVIMSILFYIERYGLLVRERQIKNSIISKRMVGFISFAISLGCMTFIFIAFYPGFFTNDSIDQLTQIYNNSYNNWHSVIHTQFLRLILCIFHSPSACIYMQMMMFSFLTAQMGMLLSTCGVKNRKIFIAVLLFALLPNNCLTNNTPLKDFPFTFALLWGTLLLFEVALDLEKLKKPYFIIKLTICLYLIKEFRHNGIIPFAFTLIMLIIITVKYWNRIKLYAILSVALSMLLVGLTEGPIFSAMGVQPNSVSPYTTMFCAVGSCINKDKTLSNKSMEQLQKVMSLEDWGRYYGRFVGHDNYQWQRNGKRLDLSDFEAKESFEIYFDALFRYPDIVIKDRLDGMNIMWDVTQPGDAGNFNLRIYDFYIADSVLGIKGQNAKEKEANYVHNPVADFYRGMTYFSFGEEKCEDQLTDMLLWRSGAYIIFFLILAIYWERHKLHRMWWAAMPLLGNILAMVLVLYHQSFRYVYFIQLLVVALTIMTFTMQRTMSLKSICEGELNDE